MKSKKNNHTFYKSGALSFFFLFLYICSFVLIAKPCQKINLALDQSWVDTAELPAYPNGTVLCASENVLINKIGYWVYWPIHRFMECRGIVYFAYDPSDEYGGRAEE